MEFAKLLSPDMKNKLSNAYRNYKGGDEELKLVPYFAQISIKNIFDRQAGQMSFPAFHFSTSD